MGDEAGAEGPLAELYAASKARSVAGVVPDILRTMSLRPDFLAAINAASGLHFTDGADQPMRRLRTHKRETVQWKNPQTGASLRVSYPTEEVTLVPISGQ